MHEELAGIAEELRSIIERLDDLAYRVLGEAVASGEASRPEMEKRLTRARHGLERVVGLLDRE